MTKSETHRLFVFFLKTIALFFGGSLVIMFVLIDPNTGCDDVAFRDIPTDETNEFSMEADLISFNNKMRILNSDGGNIGSFIKVTDGGRTKFRYRYIDNDGLYDVYKEEYVMANIEKKSVVGADRYTINRCDGTGIEYRYEERALSIDSVHYDLYKNDTLIGTSDESNIVLCKSDINMEDIDGTILATLSRSCSNSIFRDKWTIHNNHPDIVENYVVAFIGYLTTLKENE